MGSEIERRGLASPTTWSGGPMLTHPELVRDIHQEYIEAGAEIIITNTFGAGRDMLERGRPRASGSRGQQAGNRSRDTGQEKLRDGGLGGYRRVRIYDDSKERAEVPVPYEKALETYREQLGELSKGGPDVAVGEMLIRISDTLAVIDAAAELGLPVWVGLSLVRDGDELYLGIQDRHGNETLQDAMDAIKDKDIASVFIMHTSVDDTAPGLEIVRKNWTGTFGAYAHFPGYSRPTPKASAPGPQQYLEYAKGWSERGARIIGGCCGTRPAHIRALREWLRNGERR